MLVLISRDDRGVEYETNDDNPIDIAVIVLAAIIIIICCITLSITWYICREYAHKKRERARAVSSSLSEKPNANATNATNAAKHDIRIPEQQQPAEISQTGLSSIPTYNERIHRDKGFLNKQLSGADSLRIDIDKQLSTGSNYVFDGPSGVVTPKLIEIPEEFEGSEDIESKSISDTGYANLNVFKWDNKLTKIEENVSSLDTVATSENLGKETDIEFESNDNENYASM